MIDTATEYGVELSDHTKTIISDLVDLTIQAEYEDVDDQVAGCRTLARAAVAMDVAAQRPDITGADFAPRLVKMLVRDGMSRRVCQCAWRSDHKDFDGPHAGHTYRFGQCDQHVLAGAELVDGLALCPDCATA